MSKPTLAMVLVGATIVGAGSLWYFEDVAPVPTAPSVATNATTTAQASTQAAQPQGDGTDVSQNLILGLTASSTLGDYLSAYNGMTVYTYAKDAPGTSTCAGRCASNWPPYTVPSKDAVHVPATFEASAVSTITRADGALQVTYKGMPLYFYIKDARPGDAVGEGVGGVWYVARP